MSALRSSFRCLKDVRPATRPQWPSSTTHETIFAYRAKPTSASIARSLSSTASSRADLTREPTNEATGEVLNAAEKDATASRGMAALIEASPIAPYARVLPISPSYFTRLPVFYDRLVTIQDLVRKYSRLPVLPKEEVPSIAWRSKEQYRLSAGEPVKARDYAECMKLVRRLHQINPDLMPEEVLVGIAPFKREVNFHLNQRREIPLDKFGRAHAAGKRKSSVAQAWVIEGTGEVLVNGKPLSEAFGRVHDRESAVWALKSTERLDKYNVWAKVSGGGTTGQAEALTLAIAKALCAHEPALKNPLRRAGCITRDPREVERKKAGHVKARKSPTWVKR